MQLTLLGSVSGTASSLLRPLIVVVCLDGASLDDCDMEWAGAATGDAAAEGTVGLVVEAAAAAALSSFLSDLPLRKVDNRFMFSIVKVAGAQLGPTFAVVAKKDCQI